MAEIRANTLDRYLQGYISEEKRDNPSKILLDCSMLYFLMFAFIVASPKSNNRERPGYQN